MFVPPLLEVGMIVLLQTFTFIQARTVHQREHIDVELRSTAHTKIDSKSFCGCGSGGALAMLLYSPVLRRHSRRHVHYCTRKCFLGGRRQDARSRNDHACLAMSEALHDQNGQPKSRTLKVLPCGDAFDKELCRLSFFNLLNFLLLPLTGATDLFFVGKLGNPLAIAGQAAADRIYNTAALLNVIPIVTQPRVAKAKAADDTGAVQREVGNGIFLSVIVGLFLTLVTGFSSRFLLLAVGSEAALPFSLPYFQFRLIGQIPATLATVCFVCLQAVKDTKTPLKISIVQCIVNAALNYVLMFPAGLGIAGAALATAMSQIVQSIAYVGVLLRRKLLRWSQALRPPSREMLSKLTKAVGALQVRNIASNLALLAVTKVTLNIDSTGIAASAHAVAATFWQIGGVVLFSISVVGQVLIGQELGKKDFTPEAARAISRRLLAWGALMGTAVGVLQVLGLPLLNLFTPVPEVQQAARGVMKIGAMLQPINGLAFIGEGLMTATGAFGLAAKGMIIATALFLLSLHVAPSTLVGVWFSFWVWMLARLANVVYFFWFAKSPLKP